MSAELTVNPLQRALADNIIRYSPVDDLRILIACGASPTEPVTQGLTPLHYAVYGRYVEAVHLLLVRGSDVNAKDDCGYTALHLSAEHGYFEIVELLLKFQAKVICSEKYVPSGPPVLCDEPLRLALKNGHYDCARLLLEHGANPNTRYFLGCELNLISPLQTKFMELLLTFGADVDCRDRNGMTSLMKACQMNEGMESALLLISYGADVNAIADERQDFRSVLHYAVLSSNLIIVKMLLKKGASVTNSGSCRSSVLDMAVIKGDLPLVELLIEAGANVNLVSSILGSPLHVAVSDNVPNRYEIIQLLLKNGANPNIVVRTDDGLFLKPVLCEYIASNEQLCKDIIGLFLGYGAKIVLKTQHRHPLGMLSMIPTLSRHHVLFLNVMEAAESFDLVLIKRLRIPLALKEMCIDLASKPLSLRQLSRLYLRQYLQPRLPPKVSQLEIPDVLKAYLLFETS